MKVRLLALLMVSFVGSNGDALWNTFYCYPPAIDPNLRGSCVDQSWLRSGSVQANGGAACEAGDRDHAVSVWVQSSAHNCKNPVALYVNVQWGYTGVAGYASTSACSPSLNHFDDCDGEETISGGCEGGC